MAGGLTWIEVALRPEAVARMEGLWMEHGLPVEIEMGERLRFLQVVRVGFLKRDRLLVKWLLKRAEEGAGSEPAAMDERDASKG